MSTAVHITTISCKPTDWSLEYLIYDKTLICYCMKPFTHGMVPVVLHWFGSPCDLAGAKLIRLFYQGSVDVIITILFIR